MAVFSIGVHFLEELGYLGNAIVYDLDAVVEVGELVFLGADIGRDDIFEHLGDGCLAGQAAVVLLLLAVLVGLLLVDLLGGEVGLGMVVGRWVALPVGLFAGDRFCGADDELVDFERVGVFGCRGGTDTEVVAFWELDLGLVSFWLEYGNGGHTLSVLKQDSPSIMTSKKPSAWCNLMLLKEPRFLYAWSHFPKARVSGSGCDLMSIVPSFKNPRTEPPFPSYWSMTNTRPSNLEAVYKLVGVSRACDSRTYQNCKLPAPLSMPVALNSSSAVQSPL